MTQEDKDLGKPVESVEVDHAAQIKAARLAQFDERLAAAKAEVKDLTEKRKSYL